MLRAFERRARLTSFFCGDRDLLPFAINIEDSKRPEGNQIDSRHDFRKECWQKFPVPAEQVNQHGCDCNVEHVISGRQSSFGKQGKHKNLKCIGCHGQNHGGSKTRAGRERDWVFGYHSGGFHVVLLKARSDLCFTDLECTLAQ